MERIKTLMQKFQEIYYSNSPKSAIDIDLMMDYARVMYIDLIEWRREFTEPLQSDIISVMHQAEPIKCDKANPAVAAAQMPKEVETTNMEDAKEKVNEIILKDDPEPVTLNEEMSTENLVEIQDDFPEEAEIETISHQHTGISFEPPSIFTSPKESNNTFEEDAPAAPIAKVIEIPLPAAADIPLPEFKPYEPVQPFNKIIDLKDIRTVIGINDKYLFLNELFNNHKTNYEETLDKLNKINSLDEATKWVNGNAAATFKWDKEDATVQSFYAVLDKHFSSR